MTWFAETEYRYLTPATPLRGQALGSFVAAFVERCLYDPADGSPFRQAFGNLLLAAAVFKRTPSVSMLEMSEKDTS